MTTPAPIAAHAVRYACAGATVFGVYIGCTLLLSGPLGVPIWLAIAVAYVVAVSLHFTLQRLFVFRDRERFALSTRDQVWRYVILGASQYAITTAATALLPDVLGVSQQVVYVCTALALSGGVFLLLRGGVFHAA